MSTGITFDATLPATFAGNVAPIVDQTTLSKRGTDASIDEQGETATAIETNGRVATGVSHQ